MAKNPTTTIASAPEPPIGQDLEALQLGSSDELPPLQTDDDFAIEATEEEIARAAHIESGLKDPSPSVRAAFERMKLKGARGTAKQEPFRGPFIVKHRIKFLDGDGKEITLTHLMPDPRGRGMIPRVVYRGDIPDDMAQAFWADGALEAYRPAQPRPMLVKPMVNVPLPTIPTYDTESPARPPMR